MSTAAGEGTRAAALPQQGSAGAPRPVKRRRRGSSWTTRLRRGVQLLFLAAFVALVLATQPRPGHVPPGWLDLFFNVDPLIPLATGLAAHAIGVAFALSLITVVVTVLLGRVFCGWFCPLGTIHAIVSRLLDRWRPRQQRDHWSRWQLAKYYVLAGLVVMALFGVQWLVLFDPLVILYRTLATTIWPATQGAIEGSSTAIYQADPHVSGWHVTAVTEPVYRFLRDHLFVTQHQAFLNTGAVLGFFLFIVALNAVQRRFWCRYVCPLGGLLGLLAWRPWLVRKTDAAVCNSCDLCGMDCHGAASSAPGASWKPQECFGCLNCTDSCTRAGLTFSVQTPWQTRDPDATIDLSRRGLLEAAAVGVAGVALLRSTPQARGTTFNPVLLRPPGAPAEANFLAKCTGCGMCMKVCPTGGLQPSLLEAGLDGLFTPRLVPQIGYCDYECNACGHVCPTGAITPLLLAAKKEVRLGLATIDTSRCLPYAFDKECLVCEEHCPVPDKAIRLVGRGGGGGGGHGRGRGGGRGREEGEDGGEGGGRPPRPIVLADKCIGCGICENVCPFNDRPAIRVTSANESRHPDNQPILGGTSGYPV